MKILSIVWYKVLPPLFGGQKGIALFNQYLSRHTEIVCLCSSDNEVSPDTGYRILPLLPTGKKQFADPFCHKKIRSIAQREKVSHIIVEHPYHGWAGIKAKKATGAKLVIHSHNIESERFRQLGKPGWRLLRRYEKWVHRKADLNFFKSHTDLDHALQHFGLDPQRCMVVSYGIEKTSTATDPDLIRARHGIGADQRIALFAGTLDYAPNAEAVQAIFREIAPRLSQLDPGMRIVICGRNKKKQYRHLQQLSHPSVIMAGEVADMENYFAAANVFINPVQYGGGVQTKNMDALAAHCNLVCFEQMLDENVQRLVPQKVFAVANNNWDQFAQQMVNALSSKGETPEIFFEKFGWENIVRDVVDRLQHL